MKRWINSDVGTESGSAVRIYTNTNVRDRQEAARRRRTFSLPHGQQAVLVAVAERSLGDRLEVPGVNSPAGNGIAALTHAGVVAQAAFVQVRVGQGVAAGNPFGLETNGRVEQSGRRAN